MARWRRNLPRAPAPRCDKKGAKVIISGSRFRRSALTSPTDTARPRSAGVHVVALALLLSAGSVAAGGAVPAEPSADQGGPISPADIMRLHDMREAEIAPNGGTILYTVQRQISTFSPEHSAVWAVPAKGGPARPFIVSAGADGNPRWSPDGRSVAFLSNRKNPLLAGRDSGFEFRTDVASTPGAPVSATPPAPPPEADEGAEPSRQIWLISVAGGEAVPLTALPGDISDIEWSPDGKRIAFLSADPETPARKAEEKAKRDWIEVDHPRQFTRLWILDLATHAARRISPERVNVSAMAWSPDSRRMALRVADSPKINDHFYHSRLVLFDPVAGTIGATILDHAAEGPRWSKDGRTILGSEILAGGISTALRVYEVGSGRLSRLTDGYPGLIHAARWAPDSRSILALSFEKTRSRLVRVDPASGRVTKIADLDGQADDFSVDDAGRRFAVPLSSPTRPADVWLVEAGKQRLLTEINPQVAHWRLGKVEEVSWRNPKDGLQVYGVLVTPPGYRPGTPTKTVVQIHGGPEWAWWSGWLGSWHEWAQMLASHGYVVFLPNPRGSDGQGTAFARGAVGDWGGGDFGDVMSGIDMLVARGIADPNRLGIGGWSYGGFMSAWAVTHSDRFKAAVVGAGVTDLLSMARITDTPDFPLGYYGPVPSNIAAYDAASSVRLLDRVHTPVLVLHGEADTRVPISQGMELYTGLKMQGRETEMVRYPREAHWFHEPAHQQNIQERVLGWFDARL